MAKKKTQSALSKRWERLLRPYKIIVVNPHTFEEKKNWELTKGKILVYSLFITFLIIVSTFLIISYTPIKQIVSGYPNPETTQQTVRIDKDNLMKIDALLSELERKDNYINNILGVLKGELSGEIDSTQDLGLIPEINFPSSEEDSILREKVEAEERLNIASGQIIESKPTTSVAHILFFKPIDGKLTSSFSQNEGHLGIDIIAPNDEPVKATLEGTVVFSSWTPDNGYVMQIQHSNNLISVYKHNAVLLKSVGEVVSAGEPISFIGNSGELSEGPHLHFELWQNGAPINPENHISFEKE